MQCTISIGEYRLGYASLSRFSPYILIDHKHGERVGGASRKEVVRSATEDSASVTHNHSNVTYMSLGEACAAVNRCLGHERDWRVLKLVLERIPRVRSQIVTFLYSLLELFSRFYLFQVLNNKALVLSRHNTDIDDVGKALCSLIMYVQVLLGTISCIGYFKTIIFCKI